MENYLAILLLLGMASALSGAILAGSYWLGVRNPGAAKLSTYECGVTAEGSPHAPFFSRFYLVAVMFLLVDVEAAFFFPWAVAYRQSLLQGQVLLIALIVYLAIFSLGLFYIVKKDCLGLK